MDKGKQAKSAAERLKKTPGVMGVFFGRGRKAGKWQRENVISVHVRKKRNPKLISKEELIPPEIDGFETDVIEVGVPVADRLDVGDEISSDDGRRSSITALARAGDGNVYVLFSGHGVLPVKNGRLAKDFDSSTSTYEVSIQDAGESVPVTLLYGRVAGRRAYDVALGAVTIPVKPYLIHPATDSLPPLKLRRAKLRSDDAVRHVRIQPGQLNRTMHGRVEQVALTDLDVELPTGKMASYSRVTSISYDGDPFSIPGDSGSLVVDEDGLAVGTVLASARGGEAQLAYILPLEPLKDFMPDHYDAFFC